MLLTASDHPFPKSPHALSVYLTISFLLKVSNDPPLSDLLWLNSIVLRSEIARPPLHHLLSNYVLANSQNRVPHTQDSHTHIFLSTYSEFVVLKPSLSKPCFRVYTTNEDRPQSFGKVLPWVDMHSTQPLYRRAPY